jgi:signal transduction histidine kinase
VIRYAAPIVAVAVTILITQWLREFFQGTPPALLFCAIIFSGWFGGLGPGLLASALSIVAIELYFRQPFPYHASVLLDSPRLAVFFIAGVFTSLLSERQRQDKAALTQARDDLDGKVRARTIELTTANERLTVEVAERTRAEKELRRLNRAWRVRNACNQAVNRCEEEEDLLEQVCRAVVDEGGYRLAWIGYAENDPDKTIRPMARAGEGQGYLDNLVASWAESPHGLGPAGTAIRTALPVICNEFSSDPRLAPWRARAEEQGLKSSVALPLTADGRAFGGLMVYASEPGAFDEEETELLLQAANDLAHGVALLRSRNERRTAEEALKKTEAELGRVARFTTMGELTASIAHEVNQPLAAVVTNGNAGMRWLSADPPNFDEAREALRCIVRDGNRAADVIARIRAILKKSGPVAQRLDINDIVREIVALTQGEVERRGASLHTDLAVNLPAVTDRPRVVTIRTAAPDGRSVLVAVADAGTGLAPDRMESLFEAFYTTKSEGLGMGLSISRSIVEQHGGRLWAARNEGPGATFQFTLPVEEGAGA